jgi:hypothetical protein
MQVDSVDSTSISVGEKIIKHDVWLSDNFKVLGLELKDDPDDDNINRAYRIKVQKCKCHPDKIPANASEEEKREKAGKFQELGEAKGNVLELMDKRGKKLTREMRTAAAKKARKKAEDAVAPPPKLPPPRPMFTIEDFFSDDEDTGGATAEEAAAAAEEAAAAAEKRDTEEARDKAAAVAEDAREVAAVAAAEAKNAEEAAREARERATEAQAAAEKAKKQFDEIKSLHSKQVSGTLTSAEKGRLTEFISEIMSGARGGGDKKRKSKRKKSKRKKSKKRKSRRTRRR